MTSIGGKVIPYLASKLPPQTAGNDNDGGVEDNAMSRLLEFDAFRTQLRRSAPQECRLATPCKLYDEWEGAKKNGMPSGIYRLVTRPKSAVDIVRDTIKKPKGSVPPLALPNWHCLPMDNKIPFLQFPAGLMYYTPGKVCKKLHRKHKVYSVQDPYNRERIVRYPYSAVYDPNAKNFVCSPFTKKLLRRRGIINKLDEVIVPLSEFNKYRDYLRTLYMDELHEIFREEDVLYLKEREQSRVINLYINAEEGKAVTAVHRSKIEKARAVTRMAEKCKVTRLHKKEERTTSRLQLLAKGREQCRTDKILQHAAKARIHEQKLQAIKKAQQMEAKRGFHQSIMKELRSTEKRNQDLEILKKYNELYLTEWIDTKANESEMRHNRDYKLSRSCQENLKARGKIRQKRMEARRADLPNMIERRKQEKQRVWRIVRKYFYKWLNKVRQRRTATVDENHISHWVTDASSPLDKTVHYLRYQAGLETKLDDFVLNMMELKRLRKMKAIRKQMIVKSDSDSSGEEKRGKDQEEQSMAAEKPSRNDIQEKKRRSRKSLKK